MDDEYGFPVRITGLQIDWKVSKADYEDRLANATRRRDDFLREARAQAAPTKITPRPENPPFDGPVVANENSVPDEDLSHAPISGNGHFAGYRLLVSVIKDMFLGFVRFPTSGDVQNAFKNALGEGLPYTMDFAYRLREKHSEGFAWIVARGVQRPILIVFRVDEGLEIRALHTRWATEEELRMYEDNVANGPVR
jgi:hypothetical protein